MNRYSSLENVSITLDHKDRLNLYASLSNQTPEQAAQSILAEFLDMTGEVRIEHWLGEVRRQEQPKQNRKPRRSARTKRTFDELITPADWLYSHGMGISLI